MPKLRSVFLLITSLCVLCGCAQHTEANKAAHQHARPNDDNALYTYRVHPNNDNDSWLYYYVLYTSMGGTTHSYYATSSTPVDDYRSLSFTRSPYTAPPPEVEAATKAGQMVGIAKDVTEQELPADAKSDIEAAYAEYEKTQNELDQHNEASENPAPPSEPSSTAQEAETGGTTEAPSSDSSSASTDSSSPE